MVKGRKVIVGLVGTILMVYVCGYALSKVVYLNNTVINGVDISYLSADTAKRKIEQELEDYVLKVETIDNKDIDIRGEEIGLRVELDDEIYRLVNDTGNRFSLRRVVRGLSGDIRYSVDYDRKKLDDIIGKSSILDGTKASCNARIGDNLEIIKDIQGNVIDTDKFNRNLSDTINRLDGKFDLLGTGCYIMPTITEGMLKSGIEELKNRTRFAIKYDIGNNEYVYNWEHVKHYIDVDSSGNVEISDKAISDFIDNMSKDLNTLGDGIKFKTSRCGIVDIPGGNWGWWLDKGKTKSNLSSLIEAGKDGVGTVYWKQEGNEVDNNNVEIFRNYVEIDLRNQHLYLYTNSKLVGDWDIVSGTYTSKDRRTPAGVYRLTYKERNAVLRGRNYASPVKYWMPFNGGIGMHDASWRNRFGGSIYKYNGSHGCINMPLDGAKAVYGVIDSSYAIVCYD